MRGDTWTEEEVETLIRMVNERCYPQVIADTLNRSRKRVCEKSRQIGYSFRGNKYAVYLYDKFISSGTAVELSNELGIEIKTIYRWTKFPTKSRRAVCLGAAWKKLF